MSKNILLIALLLVATQAFYAPGNDDNVTFPQWPENYTDTFKTYSGLLNVSESDTTRNIHYVLLESMKNVTTDPLVLWLNGGPGCSSLLGLMQEVGAFQVYDGTDEISQKASPYAWNNIANVLYFESPAGVGFSQNDFKDWEFTDNNTALDSYTALLQFFDKYEDFKNRTFYIAGESYAGMYIPYLARTIIEKNKDAKDTDKINLQGIMVGNGVMVMDDDLIGNSTYDHFDNHQFFGPELSEIWNNDCKQDQTSPRCQYFYEQAEDILYRINPYDPYGYCYTNSTTSGTYANWTPFYKKAQKMMAKRLQSGFNDQKGNPNCDNFDFVMNYFNDKSVQEAINVPEMKWEACSGTINMNYKPGTPSVDIYPEIIDAGVRVVIFSGDTDGVVPTVYTQKYIYQLANNIKASIKKDWNQWVTPDSKQIGGYQVVYDGFSFVTIRGAGHQVPQYRPEAGYYMYEQTLKGEDL